MDKKLSGLLVVFFLLFTLFASTILFNTQLSSITRAKEDYAANAKASLLFAYPLLLKADGKTKSTISVFVRSEKGMPVKNEKVVLSSSLGSLHTLIITTDDKGKATTTITSDTPGTSSIEAIIGGSLKVSQKLSIIFE